MTNYDKIINTFIDCASRLTGVSGFITGQIEEVDIKKLGAEAYPLLYIEPQTATIDTGSLTYSFSVYIMEQTLDDITEQPTQVLSITNNYEQIRESRNNSYNNTLATLRELINVFKQNLSQKPSSAGDIAISNIVESDMVLQVPITAEPFTMRFNNILTGWTADIEIEVDNTNDLCTSAVYVTDL
jgi:hypothetical protein